jgi:hypothetical protein
VVYDKLVFLDRFGTLNARTDFTRRATTAFMLGRNLAQFNDCPEGICKTDNRDQPTSTTQLSEGSQKKN